MSASKNKGYFVIIDGSRQQLQFLYSASSEFGGDAECAEQFATRADAEAYIEGKGWDWASAMAWNFDMEQLSQVLEAHGGDPEHNAVGGLADFILRVIQKDLRIPDDRALTQMEVIECLRRLPGVYRKACMTVARPTTVGGGREYFDQSVVPFDPIKSYKRTPFTANLKIRLVGYGMLMVLYERAFQEVVKEIAEDNDCTVQQAGYAANPTPVFSNGGCDGYPATAWFERYGDQLLHVVLHGDRAQVAAAQIIDRFCEHETTEVKTMNWDV